MQSYIHSFVNFLPELFPNFPSSKDSEGKGVCGFAADIFCWIFFGRTQSTPLEKKRIQSVTPNLCGIATGLNCGTGRGANCTGSISVGKSNTLLGQTHNIWSAIKVRTLTTQIHPSISSTKTRITFGFVSALTE